MTAVILVYVALAQNNHTSMEYHIHRHLHNAYDTLWHSYHMLNAIFSSVLGNLYSKYMLLCPRFSMDMFSLCLSVSHRLSAMLSVNANIG